MSAAHSGDRSRKGSTLLLKSRKAAQASTPACGEPSAGVAVALAEPGRLRAPGGCSAARSCAGSARLSSAAANDPRSASAMPVRARSKSMRRTSEPPTSTWSGEKSPCTRTGLVRAVHQQAGAQLGFELPGRFLQCGEQRGNHGAGGLQLRRDVVPPAVAGSSGPAGSAADGDAVQPGQGFPRAGRRRSRRRARKVAAAPGGAGADAVLEAFGVAELGEDGNAVQASRSRKWACCSALAGLAAALMTTAALALRAKKDQAPFGLVAQHAACRRAGPCRRPPACEAQPFGAVLAQPEEVPVEDPVVLDAAHRHQRCRPAADRAAGRGCLRRGTAR